MSGQDPSLITAEIDRALASIAALGESQGGAQAQQLARSIMALYGEGLARIMELARADRSAAGVLERLTSDPLIGSLLALHGLHPEAAGERIQRALAALRPALPPGVDALLESADQDRAHVRVVFHSAAPVRHGNIRRALTRAIQEAAPEIDTVHFTGLHDDLLQIIRPERRPAASSANG